MVRGTRVIVRKPNFLQTIDPCNTITNKKLYALSAKHIPTRNLTDPKSAHTLQVITAELLTKYKVIMFSSIGEMCDEKSYALNHMEIGKNLHTALSVCWIIASFQHEEIFLEGYGQIQNKMVGYELFTR